MKQKDIAMLLVIVVISGALSFFVGHLIFSKTGTAKLTAEHVDPITTDFMQPDPKYFNSHSIDPTQTIRIGTNNNAAPFVTGQ